MFNWLKTSWCTLRTLDKSQSSCSRAEVNSSKVLMPSSSEFVTLCQAQVSLVASLGASLSVVYLAQDWVDGGDQKLIPIAAYPETTQDQQDPQTLMPTLPKELTRNSTQPRLLAATTSTFENRVPPVEVEFLHDSEVKSNPSSSSKKSWQQERQFVLPLMRDGAILGFLVTAREDRPWNKQEQRQIQAIAHTLTTACILDQRAQWFQQQFTQQRQLQAQQENTLHNLLHQLKSPLTAVRTFGKLLKKRLLPEDKNHKIAGSILRESDRIQDLLQQVDQTLTQQQVYHPLSGSTDALNSPLDDPECDVPPEPSEPPSPDSLALLPTRHFLEPTSVLAVLEPLLDSARAIAQECQVNCQVNLASDLPPVQANAKALREVLSNLLDNAIKYTQPRGSVFVQVKQSDAIIENLPVISEPHPTVGIIISDTGSGIPINDLKHLFERGYRGVQAQSEIPGTGLGLAIAQNLVAQMEGKIEVFSPNPEWVIHQSSNSVNTRSGTTFIVWLKVWV